jgi:hypothetical protein
MRLLLMYHETIWLLDVYFFLNLSIEKCCLYIHLMYSPTHGCYRGNNHPDRSVSSNKNKCILIIYSLHLRESSSNKSRFVPLDAPISYMFDLIDSFGSHYRLPFRSRNNIPHIILHDGLILLHHGISPYWMTSCFLITVRFRINDVAHSCGIARISLRYLSLSEGTISSCLSLNLSLTKDVDLIFLRILIVPHKCTLST